MLFWIFWICYIFPRIYQGLIDSAVREWPLQACISPQAEHFENCQFVRLSRKYRTVCLSHVNVNVLKLRTL